MKWGPTSGNCCPARIVFVRSPEAKERLKPALDAGNVAQTMAAPATAIVALRPRVLREAARCSSRIATREATFVGKPELIRATAMQSGTLQGAYLIVAARALGLDCGPMGGFDAARVDAAFFPEGKVEVELPLQPGIRRSGKAPPARAAARVRRGMPDCLVDPLVRGQRQELDERVVVDEVARRCRPRRRTCPPRRPTPSRSRIFCSSSGIIAATISLVILRPSSSVPFGERIHCQTCEREISAVAASSIRL